MDLIVEFFIIYIFIVIVVYPLFIIVICEFKEVVLK